MHLIPCPNPPACGVKFGHEPGSFGAQNCEARQLRFRKAASGASMTAAPSSTGSSYGSHDPDSFHGVYSNVEEVASDDPGARSFEVTLEYGDLGEMVIDGISRPNSIGGEPSTAEVLQQVASEVAVLRYVNPEFLNDNGRTERLDQGMRDLLGEDYAQIMDLAQARDQASYPDALSDSLRMSAVDA